MVFPDNTEPTDTSSRTAVAVGVAVITVLVLLIIAAIAGYFIVRRVKGHTKPDSSTLPSVHYQPHADINMQPEIQNAAYSSGICCVIDLLIDMIFIGACTKKKVANIFVLHRWLKQSGWSRFWPYQFLLTKLIPLHVQTDMDDHRNNAT